MGFDENAVKLLLVARARGASFTRTATLGRHTVFAVSARHLARDLSTLGLPTTVERAHEILTESPGWSEPLLRYLGAQEICSIDNSDYESASLIHDLNEPIPGSLKNRFTAVIDGGTLEHVFNFPVAIKNAMEMLEMGGVFIGISPVNNFMGHGFYQFGPELYYRVFSPENGFMVNAMVIVENFGWTWYEVRDPAQVGHRVQLRNMYPTNLLVIARRVEIKEPFRKGPPQQSDYVTVWDRGELKPLTTGLVHRILGALYRDFRVYQIAYRAAMPVYAATSPWLRSGVFRRTTPEKLASGARGQRPPRTAPG